MNEFRASFRTEKTMANSGVRCIWPASAALRNMRKLYRNMRKLHRHMLEGRRPQRTLVSGLRHASAAFWHVAATPASAHALEAIAISHQDRQRWGRTVIFL
jgi:hypothetical protein